MVAILPSFKGMAIVAKCLPVRDLIVVSIAVYMVHGQLAFMDCRKVARLTVVFLMKLPRSLNVNLGNVVLVVAPVKLFLTSRFLVARANTHIRPTDRARPYQLICVDVC